jgi:uncharacterized sulfatase
MSKAFCGYQYPSDSKIHYSSLSRIMLRSTLAFLIAFIFSLTLAIALPAQDPAAKENSDGASKPSRPNIILILSDDQKWSDYGFMGHEKIQTPNLDQLAQSSILFRQGYVPQALCRSSLMSIVTGRYPHQHRIVGNDPWLKTRNENPGEFKRLNQQMIDNLKRFDPIAKVLGENGYVSHQSGKWWEGGFENGGFENGGFDQGMTLGMGHHARGRHGDVGLEIGRKGLEPVFNFVDEALENEKPFFVWYAPFLPHTPHNPPERLLKKYNDGSVPVKIAKYYAMCEWFDETCGELVSGLDDRKIRENTLIVYVCDNGWISSVPGMTSPKNWNSSFSPRTKRSANEGGIRTPIFFQWPAKLKAADRPERVTSLDLYPTILAAAGCPIPEDLPGLNLLPTLMGEEELTRKTLFGESFSHDVQVVDDPDRSLLHRWCIDGDWKLILSYDTPIKGGKPIFRKFDAQPPRLYDLSKDPEEENDLSGQFPEKLIELQNKISDWRAVENKIIR